MKNNAFTLVLFIAAFMAGILKFDGLCIFIGMMFIVCIFEDDVHDIKKSLQNIENKNKG